MFSRQYLLANGNAFDLNRDILGKTSNLNSATSRLVGGEELIAIKPLSDEAVPKDSFHDTYRAINAIHGDKVIHVLQENGGLDNLLQARTRGLENFGKVGQNLTCLVFNATLNELAYKDMWCQSLMIQASDNMLRTSGRDKRDLARGVNHAVHLDGLSYWKRYQYLIPNTVLHCPLLYHRGRWQQER